LVSQNDDNYEYWFSAAQYLLYGGTIKVIRTDATDLKNAVTNGTAVKIQNNVVYETTFESSSPTWYFAAKTPGEFANGIKIYVTDAGPDQILTLDAPASGNEWQFGAGDAISASTGAAGKVYKYSLKLTLNAGVVGKFVPGAATVGDSIDFGSGNDIADSNAGTVNIGSAQKEYQVREVFPGLRWTSIGTRPGTSPFVASKNGYRDEIHVVVVDSKGTVTGTPNTILEKFVGLSKASDAKTTNGENNYYKTALKSKSAYLYAGAYNSSEVFAVGAVEADGDWGQTAANTAFNLVQGLEVTSAVSGEVFLGSTMGATQQYELGASTGTAGVSAYNPSSGNYSEAYSC